jgi:hypothetical protein
MDQTKAWLGQLWSPAVMVLASREADELCTSSTGLAVNELLRPFGVLRQLNNGLGGGRHRRRAGSCSLQHPRLPPMLMPSSAPSQYR